VSARDEARRGILASFGAVGDVADELLRYNASPFADSIDLPSLPLPDEPFVADWSRYAADAATRGAWMALRDVLVQLRFPIEQGISDSVDYGASTRAGAPSPDGQGVELEMPDALRLFIHPTAAGRIPVLLAGSTEDFRTLVRALTRKNEPVPLPASMGAAMVAGYNNWDRVARLRRAWEAGDLVLEGAEDWSAAFRIIRERKELYQDRFVLLSPGPYSGVGAGAMGMGDEEWRLASVQIRLEHECAHYFTRRVLGAMRNNLLDELIADYVGIACAAGSYRAAWFLRFVGLEGDGYREGGRLQNYRGDPALSVEAFVALQSLVRAAARALETADAEHPGICATLDGRARAITALAGLTLEEMAPEDGAARISARMAGEPATVC
jgi:hypothetical protein